ncbi:MAG: dephospho-CoA kinase [Deltaproteobacteria bacterium]|nr:MAG: dephospho-CoA kinase [Deltaproteobacteria bacterium]
MLRVGLTGGIASGKTIVCHAFARLGAKVIDADRIAREVVCPQRPAWVKLRQAFGPEFFHADGSLHRRELRRLVFSDPDKRRQLNEIIHPEVIREIQLASERVASIEPHAILVVDVPLLLETGMPDRFDRVVVVYADEDVQIDRLMRRDQLSLEEAMQALAAQLPLREKVTLADFVIDNSGSLKETQSQVISVWRELLSLAHNGRCGG